MKNKILLKKKNLNIKIVSKKIKLIPLSKKHLNKNYLSWFNDIDVTRYLESRHEKMSTKKIINYINLIRSNKKLECFAIEDFKNKHIGNIFLTSIDKKNKIATYGILIGDLNARLNGYGLFGSLLIIEFLFNKIKVNKIVGSCISENNSSWRLLERIGFNREGHLKNHVYKSKNSFYDSFIYGLQKKDWVKKRKVFKEYIRYIKYI